MYLIAKDNIEVVRKNKVRIKLNMSQVWKVVRTPQCKAGEYALIQKDDNDKFTIFAGYVSYQDICDWFEMMKGK